MSNLAIAQARDRTKFLGGSDSSPILGVNKRKSAVMLWEEKVGLAEPVRYTQRQLNAFKRGQIMEPYVIDQLLDKLKEEGHEVEVIERNKVYTDKEHDFLQCEIDAEFILDGEHINVDIKTAGDYYHYRQLWGEEGSEEIPIYHAAQFMHGLMITGRKKCLVAPKIGYDDVMIYWLNHDQETIDAMRAKEIQFWNEHVLKGVPPDPRDFEDLSHIFFKDNGKTIEATPEIAALWVDLKAVRSQIKDLQKEEDELTFEIAKFMGGYAEVTYDYKKHKPVLVNEDGEALLLKFEGKPLITWKSQQRRDFQEKRFKEEHPDLAAPYIKESSSRVFRIK